ncbi:MAG: hypothetical protein OXF02_04375 [Simkaniaceae bacterium]|nr:hypothetical protein [Simkaniaceae bacterium]
MGTRVGACAIHCNPKVGNPQAESTRQGVWPGLYENRETGQKSLYVFRMCRSGTSEGEVFDPVSNGAFFGSCRKNLPVSDILTEKMADRFRHPFEVGRLGGRTMYHSPNRLELRRNIGSLRVAKVWLTGHGR